MEPAIIEVAINGMTSQKLNPNTPQNPAKIAADAIRCLDGGAAIIHNHIEDIALTHDPAGERYGAGWQPILNAHPDAILCPTIAFADRTEDRVSHLPSCARLGARMGSIDMGSVNLATTAEDGSPGAVRVMHVNGYDDLDISLSALNKHQLGPSIAVYDPTFLRATIAYHRSGKLPRGAMVKLYFGGSHDMFPGNHGSRPAISFGLPPTLKALEAYLEMLEGSGLPWSVAVLGGDATASGIVRYALERGGHVRIGLEDYAGSNTPSNMDLLQAALEVCQTVGRPPATCQQAARILGLPRKAQSSP